MTCTHFGRDNGRTLHVREAPVWLLKPLIAVTLGDPAGIGPEITVKALADKKLRQAARMLVVGDISVLRDALRFTGITLNPVIVREGGPVPAKPDVIPVINLDNLEPGSWRPGEVSAAAGRAAFEYIRKSIELAAAGVVDAVATSPINKESFKAAGVPYIGHTEVFAALTGTPDPLTMFEVRSLRIFFLSRHVPLRKALDLVTKARITDYAVRIFAVLKQLGVEDATLAVAGLNPHSGEHGLFGEEEENEIRPAIEALQAAGYKITGPVGADSVFHLALAGRYDAVLSLYHDQGHVAAKTLDFHRTVSVTCGMPILRTSVDHGTAFDIAGKNLASAVSMTEAVLAAARYAPHFRKSSPDKNQCEQK